MTMSGERLMFSAYLKYLRRWVETRERVEPEFIGQSPASYKEFLANDCKEDFNGDMTESPEVIDPDIGMEV